MIQLLLLLISTLDECILLRKFSPFLFKLLRLFYKHKHAPSFNIIFRKKHYTVIQHNFQKEAFNQAVYITPLVNFTTWWMAYQSENIPNILEQNIWFFNIWNCYTKLFYLLRFQNNPLPGLYIKFIHSNMWNSPSTLLHMKRSKSCNKLMSSTGIHCKTIYYISLKEKFYKKIEFLISREDIIYCGDKIASVNLLQ